MPARHTEGRERGKDLSAMILWAAMETSCICYDRIDYFNDSPSTNHALVMQVLGRVRHTLEVRRDPTVVSPEEK
jgi:hypothetical protein